VIKYRGVCPLTSNVLTSRPSRQALYFLESPERILYNLPLQVPAQGKTMKTRSTLERQMLTYFGLIAAASLLITVEFVWAVKTAMLKVEILSTEPLSACVGVISALTALQNKAFLMGAVQAIVTLIVLIMLIRRITGPLRQMVEQARLISEGDLSRSIKIRKRDEIGLIGETINGLTSNIQEIVAFGLEVDSGVQTPLEKLGIRLAGDPVSQEYIKEIESGLSMYRSILAGFKLLPPPAAENEQVGRS
jgi:methyl-accepting chemotaxis protein